MMAIVVKHKGGIPKKMKKIRLLLLGVGVSLALKLFSKIVLLQHKSRNLQVWRLKIREKYKSDQKNCSRTWAGKRRT